MLAGGYTEDGLEYRIYWTSNKLQVIFVYGFKEIWVLEDVNIKCEKEASPEGLNEHCVVYVGSNEFGVYRSSKEAQNDVAEKLGYRLQHDGSWVVRGRKGKLASTLPFGRATLFFDSKNPKVHV